jgi:hypothetical protein
MIVYRKTEEECVTLELLMEVAALAEKAELRHDAATELLIEMGRLEAGVTDAIFPEADGVNQLSMAARRASVLAGHVFLASWEERTKDAAEWASRLLSALKGLAAMALPWKIKTRVPEGYVHYGLFPEVYIKAAKDFFERVRPAEAVCIGLRSIGTSLSAVVAATLEELGCQVRSFTFRPKGHPFRRKARLSAQLEEALKEAGCTFLIVDEGPGLSGTSFSSAAKKISSLGVDDKNIFIFPSWAPDGTAFISAEAREVWGRHEKFTSSFEELWIKSGRLAREASVGPALLDISAGMWRTLFYKGESEYPATHPRHERRKYLSEGEVLLKFAGHGRYGREKLRRASAIADAGYGLPVEGIYNGFIKSGFVEARPLTRSGMNQVLLDEMARYLAFLRKNFEAEKGMAFDEFCQMATRNITLGLGGEWAEKTAAFEALKGVYESGAPVEVDGRMTPVEWLLTKNGYKKADSLDHHSDQFFPSSQDISWDLASAIIEFDMSPMEQRYFVSMYSAKARETVSPDRLRLYMVAYLSFKLGYASFAAEELAATPEGPRFKDQASRYAARLKREILWITA